MPKLHLPPAYDPETDPRIPYYDRTPETRRIRACLVKFVDSVGSHLICPRAACRREGACADRDPRALPFCWEHYRGTLRFLLMLGARMRGIDMSNLGPSDPEEEGRQPAPFRGTPLFAMLAAKGVPVETLARSIEDGPETWGWENEPELVAFYKQAGPGRPS